MKNKKTLMIILGIFALVIVTTSASFAFFTYSRVGNTKATIISGDIEFSYIEGDSAELKNAFPVDDEIGAVDTTGEYDFQVKLKSSSVTTANYNVYLVDNNTSTNHFTNEQIKFALIKNEVFVANTSATEGVKLSTLDGFNEGTSKGEGIVLSDQEISSGETDNYKLRIWISDDVSYNNTYETDGTMTGKYNSYTYSLKVKVTSGITNTITIGNINVSGKTITADLSDPNGLSAYAVTQSSSTPAADSEEWIEITSDTAKSNVIRTATDKVTSKTISYTVNNYGTYYLHVKNINNETKSKSFVISETVVNEPIIKTGMIPVVYDGTNWVKADTKEDWYNYDDFKWANAVTVSEENRQTYLDAKAGTPISMDDINTMWVWIPRYEYETITSTTATEIKVNFLSGTESNKTDNYITHPAFTFGDKELEGIWVAKFEASSDTSCTPTNYDVDKGCDVTSLKVNIKPNVTSWRGIRVSTLDLNTRAMNDIGNIYGFISTEVDTHAMKNLEWGAVAYLSQSKYGKYGNPDYTGANKEIYQNKSSSFLTGMSNGTPSTSTSATTQFAYNIEGTGTGASTTGTIYGIYDMSGGAWEYVMGVIKGNNSDNPMSGTSDTLNSGFAGQIYNSKNYKDISGRVWPNSKYYNLYEFGETYNNNAAYARYKTGDATTETKGWYGDDANFAYANNPWFIRGGYYNNDADAGAFNFNGTRGVAITGCSFRPVLVEN